MVWVNPMSLLPLPPARVVLVMRAVAVLGLVAAVVGGAAGWLLLGRTQAALDASLDLTADTLQALDASAGVAADSIDALAVTLSAVEQTSADLDTAFADGEALTRELADLVRGDVAGSIRAVDGSLPGLITVAGTIDTTLGALSQLPFGPAYDPEQSFRASLQTLSDSLDGLPDRLVTQADLIDDTSTSLGDVGEGVAGLAAELAGFETTLTETTRLLDTYETTITDGQALVAASRDDLGGVLVAARVGVVLLALAFAALQVVPLHLAAAAALTPARPAPGPPAGRGREGRAASRRSRP